MTAKDVHSGSSAQRSLSKELAAILEFLYGAGPLDGVWLGSAPEGKPPYWWRSKLRAAVADSFGPESPAATQPQAVKELVEALTLIANTDPMDAALDPQRAIRVAKAALSKHRPE